VASSLNTVVGSSDKVFDYLRLQKAVRVSRRNFQNGRGNIEFRNVEFRYPGRSAFPAVKALNLSIEGGSHVAIVGPSGAGKSTVFDLLLRFYDLDKGTILLDDVDIADIDVTEYRTLLGFVPQQESLISGSIFENIAFGVSTATLEDVRAAARKVAIDDFVMQLPQGYHTDLGEVGKRLSGGQKQRIAIARAVLSSPRVLLLDEANSALDIESDNYISRSLTTWAKEVNATVITIAHRLATAQQADAIIVMQEGAVVGHGSHAELLRTCPTYKDFIAADSTTVE
jgi:ATP-binding cassette subfamily B protein